MHQFEQMTSRRRLQSATSDARRKQATLGFICAFRRSGRGVCNDRTCVSPNGATGSSHASSL